MKQRMEKRECHRGYGADGVWVMCAVKKNKTKKYFTLEVENKNATIFKKIM